MDEKRDGDKKARRIFTAEQKYEILQNIDRGKTIKEGLAIMGWFTTTKFD